MFCAGLFLSFAYTCSLCNPWAVCMVERGNARVFVDRSVQFCLLSTFMIGFFMQSVQPCKIKRVRLLISCSVSMLVSSNPFLFFISSAHPFCYSTIVSSPMCVLHHEVCRWLSAQLVIPKGHRFVVNRLLTL